MYIVVNENNQKLRQFTSHEDAKEFRDFLEKTTGRNCRVARVTGQSTETYMNTDAQHMRQEEF